MNTKTIEIYNILFKSWSYSKIDLKKNVFKITLKIYLTNYIKPMLDKKATMDTF